jgi:hypothetical protein
MCVFSKEINSYGEKGFIVTTSLVHSSPLITIKRFHERSSTHGSPIINPISTFDFIFSAGPITSLTVLKNLEKVMKNGNH